jgi:flagellar biosynthetic protein FliR
MESLSNHIVPVLLVMFRMSGVFAIAPVMTSLAIPMKVRALLCFMLALCVYPTLGAPAPISGDLFTITAAAMMEVFIGFVVGYIGLLPVVAVQLSGTLMSQQMGFGLASIYNPALESESDTIGELLTHIALGTFIMLGGIETLFACVANTFARIPIGGAGIGDAPLSMMVNMVTSGFELALRVSTPVLAIIFVETLASGFVMKTMPQLNIMSIGFSTKIVLGLLAIIWGLGAMDGAIGDHIVDLGRQLQAWSEQPRAVVP